MIRTNILPSGIISPRENSSQGYPFVGFFVLRTGFMASKRMISRNLRKSRKLGILIKTANSLTDFCISLYCMGIPFHDEKGLISSDPWDWKYDVHPQSLRSLEEFKKALDYLEHSGLLLKSTCGSVYRYIGHSKIQKYRTDRPKQTDYDKIEFK